MFDDSSFGFSDEATRRLPIFDGLSNISILWLGAVASSQERRTDARICYPFNRVPDAVQHFSMHTRRHRRMNIDSCATILTRHFCDSAFASLSSQLLRYVCVSYARRSICTIPLQCSQWWHREIREKSAHRWLMRWDRLWWRCSVRRSVMMMTRCLRVDASMKIALWDGSSFVLGRRHAAMYPSFIMWLSSCIVTKPHTCRPDLLCVSMIYGNLTWLYYALIHQWHR